MQSEPNARSIYMKLYTILGCAHGERRWVSTPDDLVLAVERAKSPSFTYFRASRRRGSEVVACSSALIRERIDLCIALGLANEVGQLTKTGMEAIRGDSFAKVVAKQTLQYLQRHGADLDSILASRRSAGTEYWLPTAQTLFEETRPEMKLPEFRRLLNLLAECAHLRAVQSRIYIPTPRAAVPSKGTS